jgi:hypothetical protein
MSKIYDPSLKKRALKPPLWEGPEKAIAKVIAARAKRNMQQEISLEAWTPENIAARQLHIQQIKSRAGESPCARAQYVGIRVRYYNEKSRALAGDQEHYMSSQPKIDSCPKVTEGACPKKCEHKTAPASAVLAKALENFVPPATGEKCSLHLALYGYKDLPEKLKSNFIQMSDVVQADHYTIVRLTDPPSDLSYQEPLAITNALSLIQQTLPVSKEFLIELSKQLMKEVTRG